MNKIKGTFMKVIIFSLMAFISIGIISCSDQNNPLEPELMFSIDTVGTYNPFPFEDRNPKKDTVKKDTSERKKDTTNRKIDTTSKRRDSVIKSRPSIFSDLLVKLNLTREQKMVADRLLAAHKSCIESCISAMASEQKRILERARTEEATIKTALKNGTITKSQAREQLATLKIKVNELLKSLSLRLKVKECMAACDNEFISNLEKILNSEQKVMLSTWINDKKKRGTKNEKDTVTVKPRG
jgi:hypothetical protein